MKPQTEVIDGRTIRTYEDNCVTRQFYVIYTVITAIAGVVKSRISFNTLNEAKEGLELKQHEIQDAYGGEWFLSRRSPITSVTGVRTNLEAHSRCWIVEEAGDLISEVRK